MRRGSAILGLAAAVAMSAAAIGSAHANPVPSTPATSSLASVITTGSLTVGDLTFSFQQGTSGTQGHGYWYGTSETPGSYSENHTASVWNFPNSSDVKVTAKTSLTENGFQLSAPLTQGSEVYEGMFFGKQPNDWFAESGENTLDVHLTYGVKGTGSRSIEDVTLGFDKTGSGTAEDTIKVGKNLTFKLTSTKDTTGVTTKNFTFSKSAAKSFDIVQDLVINPTTPGAFVHASAITDEFSTKDSPDSPSGNGSPTPVPEPGSLGLLGIGLATLGLVGLKRRKQKA